MFQEDKWIVYEIAREVAKEEIAKALIGLKVDATKSTAEVLEDDKEIDGVKEAEVEHEL